MWLFSFPVTSKFKKTESQLYIPLGNSYMTEISGLLFHLCCVIHYRDFLNILSMRISCNKLQLCCLAAHVPKMARKFTFFFAIIKICVSFTLAFEKTRMQTRN